MVAGALSAVGAYVFQRNSRSPPVDQDPSLWPAGAGHKDAPEPELSLPHSEEVRTDAGAIGAVGAYFFQRKSRSPSENQEPSLRPAGADGKGAPEPELSLPHPEEARTDTGALGAFGAYLFQRKSRSPPEEQDPSLRPAGVDDGEAPAPSWTEPGVSLPSAEQARTDAEANGGAQPESSPNGRRRHIFSTWLVGLSLHHAEESRTSTEGNGGAHPASSKDTRRRCRIFSTWLFCVALFTVLFVTLVTRGGSVSGGGEPNLMGDADLLGLAGPAKPVAEKDNGEIYLTSGAFEDGGPIPPRYTADGLDISPPLNWSRPPPRTRSLVLICNDPAAPEGEEWTHWIAYDIYPHIYRFIEGIPPKPVEFIYSELEEGIVAFRQGLNSWGNGHGWKGPDPPEGDGEHKYMFRIFAVDVESLGLDPSEATRDAVVKKMASSSVKILGYGDLAGTYER